MGLFDMFKTNANKKQEDKGKDNSRISNIKYYNKNIVKLEQASISGLTFVKEGDISLGDDLIASTRIGNYRENQEDAVALLKNGDLKMMIVADGMGGYEFGELASNIVIQRLNEWFSNLKAEEINRCDISTFSIQGTLNRKIKEISDEVTIKTNKRGGATLVCAIIGKNDTLVANVGDSRGCILKDGKLEQITIDDSPVQDLFDFGEIPSKDAMRFHKSSNQIYDSIGRTDANNAETLKPHYFILNNKEYDMLLLFSDGVTDCLSEEEIAVICRDSNREDVAHYLTEVALKRNTKIPQYLKGDPHYKEIIHGGKDNTTAAVYIPNEDER